MAGGRPKKRGPNVALSKNYGNVLGATCANIPKSGESVFGCTFTENGEAALGTVEFVVWGSFCQNNERFEDEFNNKQCTAIAVMAVCMTKVEPVRNWTGETLDRVLLEGHKLYKHSLRNMPQGKNHLYYG